jgi:hypothetical protein
MKSWTKACWAPLIAASFVAVAHADDMGVVRITDRPAPTPDPGPAATAPAAPGAACPGAGCDGAGAAVGGGCYFNPTRGFRPYAAAPVYREAVVYYRYWPDKWYGDPSFNLRPMFPQVYQPTDTTQKGFYYARVPQWMPNPNMYPPKPRPEDWHRHVIYAGGDGGCGPVAGIAVGASTVVTPAPSNPASPGPGGAPRGWPTVPAAPYSPPPTAAPAPLPPSAMLPNGGVQPAAADGQSAN